MPSALRARRRRPRTASRPLFLESLENRSLMAIDLISAALPSAESNQPSTAFDPPSITANGRYVGFVSAATNLVVGDTNRLQDVFVRDTTSGSTRLISKNASGGPANGPSDEISLTPDGRYAVFSSLATNLTAAVAPGVFTRDLQTDALVFIAEDAYAPSISNDGRYVAFMAPDGAITGDNNGSDDVFLWDRTTGLISLVSSTAAGDATNTSSVTANPVISGDGRFVAFNSNAANLVANDTNGSNDIFRKAVASGAIVRVSVGAFGEQANGASNFPSISTDGRFVAFRSNASNFIANDTTVLDIFVKDLQTAAIRRASETVEGNPTNGTYFSEPVLSGDARFVTFESDATNLVNIDTNGLNDAFLKDLQFGTVTLTSTNSAGVQGNGTSFNPTSTSDGRFVAYYSFANNLVSGDGNGFADVFWKDRQTNQVQLVSSNFDPLGGFSGNDNSFGPGATSSDGRYVAFTSAANDLVANDTNGASDIFLRDRQTGTTTRVSTDSNGLQLNADSYWASLSGDGRYLTFTSEATNLVANDSNGFADIFRKDLVTGAVLRVTVTALGLQSNFSSDQSMVSDDGRYVVFYSLASNLVSGDSNNAADIFRKDMQSGVIVRVTESASGTQANAESDVPSLSADGRFVAFQSFATNLIASDTNNLSDVFVKDMQQGTVSRVSVSAAGTQANGDSFMPRLTPNGLYVAYQSAASNLVTGDTNNATDVFLRNLSTGAVTRASTNAAGVQGNFASTAPVASNDGRYVSFLSNATNLVTGDTNLLTDVFKKDLTTGTITRLSVSDTGLQANGTSDRVSMTRDGAFVTFASLAENLTSYDGQGFRDVFIAGQVSFGLGLTLSATSVSESVGSITGTVTRTGNTTSALVVTLASSNTSVATVPATVTIAAGQSQATFTITIIDPSTTIISATAASFGTASQTLTVTGVNDAPTFTLAGNPPSVPVNSGLQTVSNFATNISPGGPDESGQALAFIVQVVSTTGNLTFSAAPAINETTGTLTYAVAPGTSGTAEISVILFDDGGTANGGDNTSNPQSFTITVVPANPALPTVFGAPGNQTIRQNENTGLLGFTVGDNTTPAGNLVVTATSNNQTLIPNGNIQLGGAGTANRTILITPATNQIGGPATITVNVRDAQSNTTTFQFTVTVIARINGDIFADGMIDSQDVAFIVYYYSAYGPGPINRLPLGPPQRADVNGDGNFDPQDVLLVIFEFNGAQGGEGEEAGAVAADAPPAEDSTAYDAAILQLFALETIRKKK